MLPFNDVFIYDGDSFKLTFFSKAVNNFLVQGISFGSPMSTITSSPAVAPDPVVDAVDFPPQENVKPDVVQLQGWSPDCNLEPLFPGLMEPELNS